MREINASASKKTLVQSVQEVLTNFYEERIKNVSLDSDAFFLYLSSGISQEIDNICKTITQLAPDWPLDKINPMDKSILILGIYEICFAKDAPDKVIMNECIELAKKFGADSSAKFINGVLNTASKQKNS